MKNLSLPEIDYLAELIGELIEYWGFKHIHGRIWLHLNLSQRPLDAQDLMDRLNVSKALISISMKDLIEYDVVKQAALSQTGTRTYVTNSNINEVIERILRSREKVMLGKIRSAFNNLKQLPSLELDKFEIQPSKLRDLDKLVSKGEKLYKTLASII